MRRFLYFVLILCLVPLASGCAPLIIGAAAGGLGVYVISRDTVEGDTDKNYDALWGSALTIAGSRGLIQKEDANSGTIELGAESSKVWIRLTRLTTATTRMRVSARKYRLPNLELAQDIFVKIITGVK